MSKQPTQRQIETAKKEIARAIRSVVETWREHNPYPSWEAETEWHQQNPSPREQHERKEREVKTYLEELAHPLVVGLEMSEIYAEDAYESLQNTLSELHKEKLRLLKV